MRPHASSNAPRFEAKFITLRRQGKDERLSYSQAFAFGHTLLRRERAEAARTIFQHLTRLRPEDRPAKIMLARCQARLKDYAACKRLLDSLFEGELQPIAERLHTALVYRAVGFYPEARKELSDIVKSRPELPTPCLVLGDLYEKVGRRDLAEQTWSLAATRDHEGGAVANSVQTQLQLLRRTHRNPCKPGI